MATCWECDGATNRPLAALLPSASRSGQRVALCPACYQGQCLRLISDIAGHLVVSTQALGKGPGGVVHASSQAGGQRRPSAGMELPWASI